VKVVKSKAYFKRFQVKFRRRREGKTDYRARKRLTTQDKNKYNAPKYRLVVRFTNSQVITQIVYSELEGDKTLASAYSSELKRKYKFAGGVKNYAAAYATGLLIARRLLSKLGLADTYKGQENPDGKVVTSEGDNGRTYYVAEVGERRPFHAVLDLGIRSTTTGARVFGALKGATDGGLDVPHSHKRFPGYVKKGNDYKADVHKAHIFGLHVAGYMKSLQEEDAETYQRQFATYVKGGLTHDKVEAAYKNLHAAIRKDPAALPKKAFNSAKSKKFARAKKLTREQRQDNVNKKILAFASRAEEN